MVFKSDEGVFSQEEIIESSIEEESIWKYRFLNFCDPKHYLRFPRDKTNVFVFFV